MLISGDMPAIEVSGMFVLRGGGGAGSSECGRYSVAVESFRLLACCTWQRKHSEEALEGRVRAVVVARLEANLKMLWEYDVKGRCRDMVEAERLSRNIVAGWI